MNKKCSRCFLKKDINNFSWVKKDVRRHAACKSCHNKYVRELYNKDGNYRQTQLKRIKAYKKSQNVKIKKEVSRWKDGGCSFCPETEKCCLAAHHLNPKEKAFTISRANAKGRYLEAVKKELRKCICVCHNCHSKIHAGIIKVSAVGQKQLS